MLRVQMCLAAEGVTVDQESNSLSIYSVLEGIAAEGFPVLIQRTSFLCVLTRNADDPSELQGQFSVSVGEAEVVPSRNVSINFRDRRRTRVIVRMQLVVPQPGEMTMRLRLGRELVGEYKVEITQTQPSVVVQPVRTEVTTPAPTASQRQRRPRRSAARSRRG